jgi:hypothetical protein
VNQPVLQKPGSRFRGNDEGVDEESFDLSRHCERSEAMTKRGNGC